MAMSEIKKFEDLMNKTWRLNAIENEEWEPLPVEATEFSLVGRLLT